MKFIVFFHFFQAVIPSPTKRKQKNNFKWLKKNQRRPTGKWVQYNEVFDHRPHPFALRWWLPQKNLKQILNIIMETKKTQTLTLMLLAVIYLSSFFVIISLNDSDLFTIFEYFRTLFFTDISNNRFWYFLSWLSFISLFLSTYCYISYLRDAIAIKLKESVFFSLTSFTGFSLLFFLFDQNTAKEFESWSMNFFPLFILFFAISTEYDFIRLQPDYVETSNEDDRKKEEDLNFDINRPAKSIGMVVGVISFIWVLQKCNPFGEDLSSDFFSFLHFAYIIVIPIFCFQYVYKKYKSSK